MTNRVTVKIYHKDYSIIAEEEPEYIRRCAGMVAEEVERVMAGSTLSLEDGAILTALNLADLLSKEQQDSARIKAQLQKLQEENRRMQKDEKQQKREDR